MPLDFAAPWALAALAVLPVLWWLLRVTPPAPRRQSFPAMALLLGLDAREDSAARTPWWVLALRLLAVLCLVLAAARPLLNPGQGVASGAGPLLLVVDDGWASARDWPQRQTFLDDMLAQAERADRPVRVQTTAAPADGGPLRLAPLMGAVQARAMAQALEPKPWPADRAAVLAALRALPREQVGQVLWLSDGLGDAASSALGRELQILGGGVSVVTGRSAVALLPGQIANEGLNAVLRRADVTMPEHFAVRALDESGRVLARAETVLASGETEKAVSLPLPTELRNRAARLDVEGEAGAAAVVLLDERARRRSVGLAGSGAENDASLLAPLYYVERALVPTSDLHRGEISELLGRELAVMVLADQPAPGGSTAERLKNWVEGGGVLLRFAGPVLAQAAGGAGPGDPLLPVRLRGGGRSLGGAMSWNAPQDLAPFAETSPFAGLAIPADVRVSSQVLAEPSLELGGRVWATLSDGTPLVTGEKRGRGWVVLVHATANAAWSNLPLSGLFVDMLRRVVALSAPGAQGVGAAAVLPPDRVLNGLGRLVAPGGAVVALTGDAVPGPRHPPGWYGAAGQRTALNLAPHLARPAAFVMPPGTSLRPLAVWRQEIELKPFLLAAALVLLCLDLLVALALRGALRRAAVVVALAGSVCAAVAPCQAADDFALHAAQETRLAYVRTGDAQLDRKSRAGLLGLSQIIGQRSTARLGAPMEVNPETDPVLFFPLLYWPASAGQKPLSAAAADKLNAYLRQGGLIVLDNGAQADPATPRDDSGFRAATQGLALPPLAPVTEEHVLTRTFYLLKELPGRYDGGSVWAAEGQSGGNDGVSPVIIGGNDWAGAWAVDDAAIPLFAVIPGGERQREMAYRFGINLVMYALTGNYKADQVHLPAILERLGR